MSILLKAFSRGSYHFWRLCFRDSYPCLETCLDLFRVSYLSLKGNYRDGDHRFSFKAVWRATIAKKGIGIFKRDTFEVQGFLGSWTKNKFSYVWNLHLNVQRKRQNDDLRGRKNESWSIGSFSSVLLQGFLYIDSFQSFFQCLGAPTKLI